MNPFDDWDSSLEEGSGSSSFTSEFEDTFWVLFLAETEVDREKLFKELYQYFPEEKRSEWQVDGEVFSFSLRTERGIFHLYCLELPLGQKEGKHLSRASGIVIFTVKNSSRGWKALYQELQNQLKEHQISPEDLAWVWVHLGTTEFPKDLEKFLPSHASLLALQEAPQVSALWEKIYHQILSLEETFEEQIRKAREESEEWPLLFDPGGYPLISPQEALEKLTQEGKLEDVAVEELNLSGLAFSKPILLRRVRLGRWKSLGACFASVEFHQVEFTQEVFFSTREKPTQVKGDLLLLHCQFSGDGGFSGLALEGSLRIHHTTFLRGIFSLHRAVIRGNLEAENSTFAQVDFRSLWVEGATRFAPVSFSKTALFRRARFHKIVSFTGSTFESLALFQEARFHNLLDLSGTDFQDEVHFDNAVFHGVEVLKTCFGGPASFARANFRELARFRQSRFEVDSVWLSLHAFQPVEFEEVEFLDTASFRDSCFQKLSFQRVKFHRTADFSASVLEGAVLFHEVRFLGDLLLEFCRFQAPVDFKGSSFGGGVSLLGAEGQWVILRRSQIEGHLLSEQQGNWQHACWEYHRLKKIFEHLGEEEDADWAHYHWKVASRRAHSLSWKRPDRALRVFFDWLCLDLASGYGTKPYRLLYTFLILWLGFALLYGLVFPSQFYHLLNPSLEFTLYEALWLSLSLLSGQGCLGWSTPPASPVKALLALEGVAGLFTLFLLAITLVRRMLR